MRELAPDVFRQRMILEGETFKPIAPEDIKKLLDKLCVSLDMVALTAPTLSYCEEYGWCGHMHWVTSGVHMYTWANRKPSFFSIDIYTCKEFSHRHAVDAVKDFLGDNLDLDNFVWKEA
jgi:hypothetical protein